MLIAKREGAIWEREFHGWQFIVIYREWLAPAMQPYVKSTLTIYPSTNGLTQNNSTIYITTDDNRTVGRLVRMSRYRSTSAKYLII